MSILLGTQFYAGDADAVRRQQQALDAMLGLRGVRLVNVQWADDIYDRAGIATLAVLRNDSRTVTGRMGRRQPIVTELFDALCAEAAAKGSRYFAFANADIIITQHAVAAIEAADRDGYAMSRLDCDRAGEGLSIMTAGIDLFAYDTLWWQQNRRRFRPYVLGGRCFDNVFTAILMCHGNGVILNRHGEIRHEIHPSGALGAFDEYNGHLAALDSPYFSLWVGYWTRLTEARARGIDEAGEFALQRDAFVFRQTVPQRVWHLGRKVRSHSRFRRQQVQWMRQACYGRPAIMEQVEQGHYAQKQLGCRSSIIRWSHTARFRLAMLLAGNHPHGRLLDYGCGDGTFMGSVSDRFGVCVGADADEAQIDDCRSRFAPLANLRFCLVQDLNEARHAHAYDVVTCMETLEHCLEPVVDRVLDDLRRLCAPDGLIVISVPIEIGPVFFIKYVVRKLAALRGLSDYARYETYSLRDAWRMTFATRQTVLTRPAYGPAEAPYHSHYGFNWRRLRVKVADTFELKRTFFSPAGWCGGWLSSQVWFVCRPRTQSENLDVSAQAPASHTN